MKTNVRVRIWGMTAARVRQDTSKGKVSLQWDPAMEKGRIELSPLPGGGDETHSLGDGLAGLPAVVLDSIPGQWGSLLQDMSLGSDEDHHISPSPLERLLLLGRGVLGALEFDSGREKRKAKAEAVPLDLGAMVECATLLLGGAHMEKGLSIEQLYRCGIPTWGDSPSLAIAYNSEKGEAIEDTLSPPEGFMRCILHLKAPKYSIWNSESLQKALSGSGISFCRTFPVKCGTATLFASQRPDCEDSGSPLHTLSLSSMMRLPRGYGKDGWEDEVFKAARQAGASVPDQVQLFRRVCFSHLSGIDIISPRDTLFSMGRDLWWRIAPLEGTLHPREAKEAPSHSREELMRLGKANEIPSAKRQIEAVADNLSTYGLLRDAVAKSPSRDRTEMPPKAPGAKDAPGPAVK